MESNLSKEASPERNTPFEDLKRKVQAYLSDPKSENPYRDVNNYFRGINDPERVVEESKKMFYETSFRYYSPLPSDFDPEFGNMGTITMHLPFFYPLHVTLIGWYVGASLEAAKGLSDEGKASLVGEIRQVAGANGLIPDEMDRVERRLKNFFPPPKESKAPTLPPKRLPNPWYRNLNPFKGK